MKNLFCMIFLFLSITIFAQDILWEKSYGGKQADYLFDVEPTADYGFILAGSSLSNKSGNKTDDCQGDLDYWIWKMTEDGELDWQRSLGGSGSDILYSIKNTIDGGFILAGTSDSPNGDIKKEDCFGKEDFWIIKLDAKGGEMWQKTIGGNGQEILKSIIQTRDGGYLIGGSSSSSISPKLLKGESDKYGKSERNEGNLDYWIIKLDNRGDIQWQRTLGGKYMDILESVEQTVDDGFIIGGVSNSPISNTKMFGSYGSGDYWIVKLDKEGNIEWQKVLGGEKDDHLYIIHQTKDNGYIAGGNSSSGPTGNKNKSNKSGTDFWVLRMDEKGEILWQQVYNTGKTDVLTSLAENNDGTFLLGGYAQSEVIATKMKNDKEEINDYIAFKISSEGDEVWKTHVGSKGEDILKKLIETRDGGYLLAGTSKGEISRDRHTGKGSNDFWVVKLKDRDKKEEEQRVKLEAIPNPALQYTNIIVGFEFNSGTLTLFDINGRQLQTFDVNNRTIPLEMGIYPEGVYIVEVKTNAGTESVKVLKGNTN